MTQRCPSNEHCCSGWNFHFTAPAAVLFSYFIKITAKELQWGNAAVRGTEGGRKEGRWRQEWRGNLKNSFPWLKGTKEDEIFIFLTLILWYIWILWQFVVSEWFKFVVGNCDLWYKTEWLFHRYYTIACNCKGLASMSPFQSYVPYMLMIRTCSAHLEFFTDRYLLHISPISSRMFFLLLLSELASKIPY